MTPSAPKWKPSSKRSTPTTTCSTSTSAWRVKGALLRKVLLVGDSIRLDYQAIVQDRLADIATVSGPADNGGDSRNLLVHLDDWVIRHAPDIVHINCGLHDIKRERGCRGNAVPIAEYAHNVTAILSRLRRDTSALIVWATTTPVLDDRHAAHKSFDRLEADVETYNDVATRIANGMGIPVNNLHGVVVGAGAATMLSYDGIHFTADGRRVLGDAVADFIRQHDFDGQQGRTST